MMREENTISALQLNEWSAIGWQEHVGLPDFSITSMKAKIDTGARTTALHAVDLEPVRIDDEEWISFHIPRRGVARSHRDMARLIDRRDIRNTSGVTENRFVIETRLVLGRRLWRIEASLADREEMTFDIILGRTAIRRHRLLVAPGKSFLFGPPVAKTRKRGVRVGFPKQGKRD